MPEPTREDALIYAQLMAIVQQEAHAQARRWVLDDMSAASFDDLNAKHPKGTVERDHLTNVMGFFESCGVLVSRGLLHEDVFFDAPFAFEVLWAKVKPLLDDWQQAAGDKAAWENVQWLGRRYEHWREDRWKPKIEAIPTDRPAEKSEPAIRGFQH